MNSGSKSGYVWSLDIPEDKTSPDVQAENTANFYSAVEQEQDDTDTVDYLMLRRQAKHFKWKYDTLKQYVMQYVDAYDTVKKKAVEYLTMVKQSQDDVCALQKGVLALRETVKQQNDVIAAFSHGVGNVEVKLEEGVTTPARIVGHKSRRR